MATVRPHPPPLPVCRALAADFFPRAAALITTVAALSVVAALADGRPLSLDRTAALALPVAGFFAAAWTLSLWRRDGADIAMASAGVRPAWLVAELAVLATPLFAGGPAPHRLGRDAGATAAWRIEAGSRGLDVTTPEGHIRVTWTADGAWRDDLPNAGADDSTVGAARFAGLPAPSGHTRAHTLPPAGALLAARALALLALLVWLLRRREAPGLGPAIGGAAAAYATGEAAAAALFLLT